MKRIEVAEATRPLEQYAREIGKEPLVLTIEGQPVAALVSLENTDAETLSLSSDVDFQALIAESRLRLRREGGISAAEMRRRLVHNGA